MTTTTTTKQISDPARGSKLRAAKNRDFHDYWATARRLETRFDRLLEKYGVNPGVTPLLLRQAAAALYLWDPNPNDPVSDKDKAERTIEAGSWELARAQARQFDKHAENIKAATEAAAADRRGDASIPEALAELQMAAQALDMAWIEVQSQDHDMSRQRRHDTAKLLNLIASKLVGG